MSASNNVDFYVEHTMPAETASELLNAARARIFARADVIAEVDPPASERLVGRAAELKRVQDTLSTSTPEHSRAIIEKWGPLLRDEKAFWLELVEVVPA